MRKTTGISLLLLIFLSLCLITFSMLSLSGAVADEKLSQKAAIHTTAYYQAVSNANLILEQIDTQLAEFFLQAADSKKPEILWNTLLLQLPKTLQDKYPHLFHDSVLNTNSLIIHRDLVSEMHFSTVSLPEYQTASDTLSLSFSVPVTEDGLQLLQIVLRLPYPLSDDDSFYQITSWQIRNINKWTPDQSQNLMRLPQ